MSKLPKQRTRLPGVDRFDIELDAFLRSFDVIVFYSDHDLPGRLWFFHGAENAPETLRPAFRAALRLALIDQDTGTEPSRKKLDDGLIALGGRNRRDRSVRQRLAAYEAAQEAEYQARQNAKMPEDI